MKEITKLQRCNTTYQLKLPLENSDPVYTFCEVMDHIDLRKYLVTEENKTAEKDMIQKFYLKLYYLHLWKEAMHQ